MTADGPPARGGPAAGLAGDVTGGAGPPGRHRSPLFMAVAGTVAVLFFVLFMALGTWQVYRRAWKLDLIARVEQRVHAPATPVPGPTQWPNITAASDEYRHVTVIGTFLDPSQTLVQAVTDFGPGFWVITPLRTADGNVVLVNRGFIPADDRGRVQPGSPAAGAASASAAGNPPMAAPPLTVTGLLRITEPRGAFLRHNNPGANQWYSRDVQAIAAARGLSHVAPYFVDAEGLPRGADAGPRDAGGPLPADAPTPAEAQQPSAPLGARGPAVARAPTRTSAPTGVPPIPGLTVVRFHNSHLVYAITWYTLALMVAIAITMGLRKP